MNYKIIVVTTLLLAAFTAGCSLIPIHDKGYAHDQIARKNAMPKWEVKVVPCPADLKKATYQCKINGVEYVAFVAGSAKHYEK